MNIEALEEFIRHMQNWIDNDGIVMHGQYKVTFIGFVPALDERPYTPETHVPQKKQPREILMVTTESRVRYFHLSDFLKGRWKGDAFIPQGFDKIGLTFFRPAHRDEIIS